MKGKLGETISQWSDNIIGRAEDHTIEHRTARTACFLAAVTGLISIGINISISATTTMVVTNIVFCIIFILIYLYIRYKGKSSEVYWIIILVCNTAFAITYVNDEGAVGPTMYFWLFLVMFVSVAGGRNKKYMLALTVIIITLMYAIEWYNPGIIHYHSTRADSFSNIYFCVILCSVFGYIWISSIMTNYFNEREKVVRQKIEIEQQKDLIEDLSKRERIIHEMRLNFFTNLSHEFRTPLSLIYVTLDKLKEIDPADHDRSKHYDILHKYAAKLNHLVDEALEFRKLDAGKAKMEITKNNIVAFVSDIVNSFLILAETKSVHLIFTSNVPFLEMGFDISMIEKVLYNLLSNAIKFTPQSGMVEVKITADENKISISVEDNGIGIPKEYTDEIFKPFYQVPGTKQGTGIGLALTHEYVKLHQGEITVASELGKGTLFIIHLPKDLNASAAPEYFIAEQIEPRNVLSAQNILLEDEGIYKVTRLEKKILIVEDNADIVTYLTDFLSSHYQITWSGDGEDGFEKALSLQPDLVISDVMMPRMNGTELCHRLKTELATSHIPVILLTARTSTEHKIQGFELGADDYITKPFDRKLLLARVNNLIAMREKLKAVYSTSIKINAAEITTNACDKQFLEKVISLVESNLENPSFNLDILADNMNMSRSTFYRKIKALTNESGDDFIRSIRFKKAAYLLTQNISIAEVSYSVGFSDPKYFSKIFKKHYGCVPSEFRTT